MSPTDNSTLNRQLEELLPKCANANEIAFAKVCDLTSAKLFAVLVRILGMNAAAEDALQETFIKIWLKSGDYRSELGQPMTWLTSIARNQALDLLRKRRTREDKEVAPTESVMASIDFSQATFLDDHDTAEVLEKCLNELSEKSRECIVRAYLEGYSHDELSELHQTPLGTVKSWIRRGLLSLRECVNGLR